MNVSSLKFGSLCRKHLQSSYCTKVRVGAKKKWKGEGEGRGEEETLAQKPYDSGNHPLIFHGSVHLLIDSSSR